MDYIDFDGSKCSKLMLGTVQLGLDYGIANDRGKVPYETSRDMIEFALESGINAFDTAPNYGVSEEVVGKAFSELNVKTEDVFISDKIPAVPEGVSSNEAGNFIEDSVIQSIKKLGLDYIDVCLLHKEQDARHFEELIQLKEKGLIRMAGISVYSPNIMSEGLDRQPKAEAFQIPASLLDQRFHRSGACARAGKENVAVFIRSVFLQGLVVMGEERVPENLSAVIPVLKKVRELAADYGIGLAELAIRYALALPGATSLVMGADTVEQLKENAATVNKGALEDELFQKINLVVPELSEQILLPFHWEQDKM